MQVDAQGLGYIQAIVAPLFEQQAQARAAEGHQTALERLPDEFAAGLDTVFGHVQAPPLTGVDSDPSTVTNFEGAAGIAFISGMVDRFDRRTGDVRTLPFLFTDMRFMKGVFRGRDGHERDATFAFV